MESESILKAQKLATQLQETLADIPIESVGSHIPFLYLAITFALACFVGYYVVWSVTPALHSPLMGVTNAISSVIVVGALIAAGNQVLSTGSALGMIAVFLAGINIFGGFIVTQRMLAMFVKPKHKKANKEATK